jgi:glycosyltransferase involved in cell wall biosynthesis
MVGVRIASVQHGDYVEALRVIGSGDSEPYFGMAYSLDVLASLFADAPHLVVSLNAPPYREKQGLGELLGLPCPTLPHPIPGSVAAEWWGRKVVAELRRFAPTHVLLRSGGVVARHVLKFCTERELNTLVVFANRFDPRGLRDRLQTAAIVRMLNQSCVKFVGNHKQPATDSMVECGVSLDKAVAWDWPNARHPNDFPVKALRSSELKRIAYVGTISMAKGVGDLLAAVEIMLLAGKKVRLTAMGAGPDLEIFRTRAAQLPPGLVEFSGRVANHEAFQQMLDADVVCVPSRHEFSEGMPLTLTEALASRTPVVISDHPVFMRAFVDGEGVRVFKAKDSASLATVLGEVLTAPSAYQRLSQLTMNAYRRVECETYFGDLIDRWKTTFA